MVMIIDGAVVVIAIMPITVISVVSRILEVQIAEECRVSAAET